MRRQQSGFTLIELLVVIAIIAILAAILFPVFISARDQGRLASCKSNLKQIATGIHLYADDYNGAYPDHSSVGFRYSGGKYVNDGDYIRKFTHRYMDDTGTYAAGMGLVLKKYLKNLSVFKCPSEPRSEAKRMREDGSTWDWFPAGSRGGSSYYIKHAMCVYADWTKQPVTLSIVSMPSRTTLMYEEGWHTSKDMPYLWDARPHVVKNHPPTMRVNALCMDLHVANIDVPWTDDTYGFDGNWYHYWNIDKNDPLYWTGQFNLSRGARDIK